MKDGTRVNTEINVYLIITFQKPHSLIMMSWIAEWKLWEGLVSAEILSWSEIFCKATNHVGAQIFLITHATVTLYAPFLQLTQVWH